MEQELELSAVIGFQGKPAVDLRLHSMILNTNLTLTVSSRQGERWSHPPP